MLMLIFEIIQDEGLVNLGQHPEPQNLRSRPLAPRDRTT